MSAAGSNPLLEHAWGVSPGADRVWAQIAGIAPSSRPWERLFMVFQAFIDDSYTANGTFVLGGYVATAEAWAKFSEEWEALLPTATRGRKGYRFKMSEMARQLDRVIPFYRVIENHVPLGLWVTFNIADLQRAKERIWSDVPLIWSNPTQPFWFCFGAIVGRFHEERLAQESLRELLPLDQKVDFHPRPANNPVLKASNFERRKLKKRLRDES